MRQWYNMTMSDVVNSSTRPQAFGILQYPSLSGGSFGSTDLTSYLAASGISNTASAAIADSVHFVGVPTVAAGIPTAHLQDNVSIFNQSVRIMCDHWCVCSRPYTTCP